MQDLESEPSGWIDKRRQLRCNMPMNSILKEYKEKPGLALNTASERAIVSIA